EQKRGAEIERVSLVAIEIAETVNRRDLHERALLQYLKLNPQGSKRDLVEFQLADVMYQKGEFARAASLYEELAFRRTWKDLNLRRQAADLSLDALAKQKKDDVLRDLAIKYSHEF